MKIKSKSISIIDRGLTLDGTISGKGRLVIHGTIKGTLVGETVDIAKDGAVYAETQADHMEISGVFEGNVQVLNKLVVHRTGNCSGKVVCRNLEVIPGGILNAVVTCVVPSETVTEKGISVTPKKT